MSRSQSEASGELRFDGGRQADSPRGSSKLRLHRESRIPSPTSSLPSIPPLRKSSSLPAIQARRKRVDVAAPSMERNFVTVERAMVDFLLTPEDLEGLKRTIRRSPYATTDPEIEVLSRKDVVQRSNQKWGSPERLREEVDKRLKDPSYITQKIMGPRRLPRDERRRQSVQNETAEHQLGLFGPSGKVVVMAVVINGATLVLKFVAWYYTKSHSMFAEFLHSVADTANQIIIAVGVYTSTKSPNLVHPYGFSNMEFVTALISGVGIFCVGTGLSLYHGFEGLVGEEEVRDLTWALVMTAQDPSVTVVLMEDSAAVLSLLIAAACISISHYTQSHIPDAMGSILVGGALAAVAWFLISWNADKLIGRSIPHEQLQEINMELERDCMVRAIFDVKGIDMGNSMVRYKAEVDLDGRQLARAYLDQLNMWLVLESIQHVKTLEDLEDFMLEHGENIVDTIGSQIDRIERKLKAQYPRIRHCDLEIL